MSSKCPRCYITPQVYCLSIEIMPCCQDESWFFPSINRNKGTWSYISHPFQGSNGFKFAIFITRPSIRRSHFRYFIYFPSNLSEYYFLFRILGRANNVTWVFRRIKAHEWLKGRLFLFVCKENTLFFREIACSVHFVRRLLFFKKISVRNSNLFWLLDCRKIKLNIVRSKEVGFLCNWAWKSVEPSWSFGLRCFGSVIEHNKDVILELIVRNNMSYLEVLILVAFWEIQEADSIRPFLVGLLFSDCNITNSLVKHIFLKS